MSKPAHYTFEAPAQLHGWLRVHHASETELWVRIYKKATGERVLLFLSRGHGARQLGKLCRHRGVAPCELLDSQIVGLVVGESQIVR